jgi:hypothetical protein
VEGYRTDGLGALKCGAPISETHPVMAGVALLALVSLLGPLSAGAATFTVSTTTDGRVAGVAILDANATVGADRITFDIGRGRRSSSFRPCRRSSIP